MLTGKLTTSSCTLSKHSSTNPLSFMSYDITNTKVKELDNLHIPLAAILKVVKDNDLAGDYQKLADFKEDDEIEIPLSNDAASVTGVVEGDHLVVLDIDFVGDSSGGYLDEDWIPMLKKSTGKAVIKITWDGGDATNKILVDNGKVKMK